MEFKAEYVRNDKGDEKAADKLIDQIRRSGALDIDPLRNKEGIVNYFYLYCREAGIDATNENEIYKAFDDYAFLEELMTRYRKNTKDFGDPLLTACERLQREWDRENAKAA